MLEQTILDDENGIINNNDAGHANEQGSKVEVLKVKKIIIHGPQGKFGFLKFWDYILDYYTVLLQINLSI